MKRIESKINDVLEAKVQQDVCVTYSIINARRLKKHVQLSSLDLKCFHELVSDPFPTSGSIVEGSLRLRVNGFKRLCDRRSSTFDTPLLAGESKFLEDRVAFKIATFLRVPTNP